MGPALFDKSLTFKKITIKSRLIDIYYSSAVEVPMF